MKKRFTLILVSLALTIAGYAQEKADGTFQFIDANGHEVADGSVITVSELNADGQMVIPLRVKNVSGQKAAASIYEEINEKPGGEWQTCAFGNCQTLTQNGYSPKSVVDADYEKSIQTEWIPVAGQYAEWTATLQVHVFNITTIPQFGRQVDVVGEQIIGYGPKVTVCFRYLDPAHIDATDGTDNAARSIYTTDGRRLRAMRRGVNIVKFIGGRVLKVFKL